MDTPQRFPLTWPAGVPRKRTRVEAQFGKMKSRPGQSWESKQKLTIAEAFDRLETELDRLGAKNPILSTNIELTMTGRPRSVDSNPADPGAALYFELGGKPVALPCDTYTRAADNIAALAKHIEATRAISRLGVSTIEQAFAGFAALPPPIAGAAPKPWRQVFGVASVETIDAGAVRVLYRKLAKERAGNEADLLELNIARDAAIQELEG